MFAAELLVHVLGSALFFRIGMYLCDRLFLTVREHEAQSLPLYSTTTATTSMMMRERTGVTAGSVRRAIRWLRVSVKRTFFFALVFALSCNLCLMVLLELLTLFSQSSRKLAWKCYLGATILSLLLLLPLYQIAHSLLAMRTYHHTCYSIKFLIVSISLCTFYHNCSLFIITVIHYSFFIITVHTSLLFIFHFSSHVFISHSSSPLFISHSSPLFISHTLIF